MKRTGSVAMRRLAEIWPCDRSEAYCSRLWQKAYRARPIHLMSGSERAQRPLLPRSANFSHAHGCRSAANMHRA